MDGKGVTDVPGGRCDVCCGEIAEVRWTGSWSEYHGRGGFILSGRCPVCDIDYRLKLPNGRTAEWHRHAPELAELRSEVGPDDLDALSIKFARYGTLGRKWRVFLDRRRAGDTVWRFESADGLHHGFAVVRDGRAVSRFATLGPVS
jgi:hypothetical protein